MDQLIKISDGVALLDKQTADKIAYFERKLKEIKEDEAALRAVIQSEMEAKGVKKIITDEMTITYKAAYDKETFKSKDFKADHPDMFDEYVEISTCKASITIKVKEDNADGKL